MDIDLIFNKLVDLGICKNCALRYSSKNPLAHEHFEKSYSNLSSEKANEFVCPFCYDLISYIQTNEYRTFLETEIIASGYQFSSFGVVLLVPSATFIRDHLMYFYLLELGLNIGPIQKIETVKEIVKTKTIELIASIFGKPYVGNVDNQQLEGFDITITFSSEEGNAIFKILSSLKSNTAQQNMNKKRERNHLSQISTILDSQKETMKLLDSIDISLIRNKISIAPENKELKKCTCIFSYKVPAVVLAGRYVKKSRNISQTPLILGGNRRLGDTSLEEVIGNAVMPYFGSTEPKLCGAGREDLDVRMLGRGRPFIFEMGTPKKLKPTTPEGIEITLAELQEKINESNKDVIISDLQIIPTKNSNSTLVDSENEKRKHYRALVELDKIIDSSKLNEINQKEAFQILQKTPIRVLHRRALLERERMIYSINVTHIRDNLLYLDLVTQAGTYIKEFVHGDLGRTNPSLASLLTWDNFECDIILLDVMHVDLEWPPQTEWSGNEYSYPEMIDEMPDYTLSLKEKKFDEEDM